MLEIKRKLKNIMDIKVLHVLSVLSIKELTKRGYTVSVNYEEEHNTGNSHMCIGTISKDGNSVLFTEIDEDEDSILDVCINHGHNPLVALKEIQDKMGLCITDDEQFCKDARTGRVSALAVENMSKVCSRRYFDLPDKEYLTEKEIGEMSSVINYIKKEYGYSIMIGKDIIPPKMFSYSISKKEYGCPTDKEYIDSECKINVIKDDVKCYTKEEAIAKSIIDVIDSIKR